MDEDSFKFEIKVEVELKDGRLNTRIYAPDEELSKEASQVQRAYMMVIGHAIVERKPFGSGEAVLEEVEE